MTPLPRPRNPEECHLYVAEGCHLYIAATRTDRLLAEHGPGRSRLYYSLLFSLHNPALMSGQARGEDTDDEAERAQSDQREDHRCAERADHRARPDRYRKWRRDHFVYHQRSDR